MRRNLPESRWGQQSFVGNGICILPGFDQLSTVSRVAVFATLLLMNLICNNRRTVRALALHTVTHPTPITRRNAADANVGHISSIEQSGPITQLARACLSVVCLCASLVMKKSGYVMQSNRSCSL